MANSNIRHADDEPLATLKPKRTTFWLANTFIVCINIFFVFGVIVPVIQTGSLSAIWPGSHGHTSHDATVLIIAIISVVAIPSWIPTARRGDLILYADRIEIRPFVGGKKIVVPYDEMSVDMHGTYRFTIEHLSKESHLFNFTRKIGFGLVPRGLKNPEEIEKILDILQANAASFTMKQLS